MFSIKQKTPAHWPYFSGFFIVILIVVFLGNIYNKYQKDRIIEEKQNELSSIADLKVNQIKAWRAERLGDGNTIRDNAAFIRQMVEFLYYSPVERKEELFNWMKSLTVNFDYKSIILLDINADVKLSFPLQDTIVGEYMQSFIPELIETHKVILTDLHNPDFLHFIHLDLIIPLVSAVGGDTLTNGFLLIRIDPEKSLFPLIKTWPAPSKTSETILLRKEGDSILYLNDVRHLVSTALSLKLPASDSTLPAAVAAAGKEVSMKGFDYRKVAVIASTRTIPDSPWFLIAKTDEAELFSDFENEMLLISIIITLFILTIGSILGLLWRNDRVRYYRNKYEDELQRLALVKHFDYILKYANDIILLFDKDLIIVEANDRALDVYMYKRDEIIGLNAGKLRSPELVAQLKEQLKEIDLNEFLTYETVHRRKDNSVFPIELSARVVNIEGAKYYQTIGRDITERKRVEETLKESEEKFRKIFEESPLCMAMTGKDMVILRANMAFCTMLGYLEEEFLYSTFRSFTHPDYIGRDEISLLKLLKGEIPIYHTEKKYLCKNNAVIWGSTTVNVIRDNKGDVLYFLAMVEDITSRKKSEAELEKSFSLLKATLESTADGILAVDSKGIILQFNKKFAEMWGIPHEVLVTGDINVALRNITDQLSDPEGFLESTRNIYNKPDDTSFDLVELKDGRFFERYSQPQVINSKSGGRVWSFRDITEKKKAEVELIAAKEKAVESDKLKTAFLHNVSHEIRTPMNAIIGFSSLINEISGDEPEIKQYTDIIFQSGNQLLSIINDIVDIANVESGQVRLNLNESNLNSSLRSLNEQFSYTEREHDISILLKLTLPDQESAIITDITKLIQILSNLLNNAIKFTRKGYIEFGYNMKETSLEFFVKDTGIGIPIEFQSKIFDRFYQVDSTGSRQYGGTGLGLSICKAYVELLGGKIWLISNPGEGSVFSFTIPYKPCKTS